MIGFSGLSDHAAAGHTADLLDQSLGQALAAAGLSITQRPTHSPSRPSARLSVSSRKCFGIARGSGGEAKIANMQSPRWGVVAFTVWAWRFQPLQPHDELSQPVCLRRSFAAPPTVLP